MRCNARCEKTPEQTDRQTAHQNNRRHGPEDKIFAEPNRHIVATTACSAQKRNKEELIVVTETETQTEAKQAEVIKKYLKTTKKDTSP